MTPQEELTSIRSKIERRMKEESEKQTFPTTDEEMERFISDTPPVVVPSKYENPDWLFKKIDLEEEIEKYREEHEFSIPAFQQVARHFAKWGAEHAKNSDEKPVPADIDEAAEISFDEAKSLAEEYVNFLAKGLTKNEPHPIGPQWFREYAKKRFIAGAQLQKEKMMKEGINAVISQCPGINEIILQSPHTVHSWEFPWEFSARGLHKGDKVRIIIVKEDEK